MKSLPIRREDHARPRLSRGRIAALVLLASAELGAAAAPPAALPPDTLLLLVAPWCAPCWAELANLDALTAAAAPTALRVVMMEDGPRARAMIGQVPPERRWTPSPSDRAMVRAFLWTRAAGLPFSIATDADGRVCAERGGGLDVDRLRELVRRCRRSPG